MRTRVVVVVLCSLAGLAMCVVIGAVFLMSRFATMDSGLDADGQLVNGTSRRVVVRLIDTDSPERSRRLADLDPRQESGTDYLHVCRSGERFLRAAFLDGTVVDTWDVADCSVSGDVPTVWRIEER